jgi:hypothetical protein
VDILLGSRLPVAERTGSTGVLAGCRVDLPVHAALYTKRIKALKSCLFKTSTISEAP